MRIQQSSAAAILMWQYFCWLTSTALRPKVGIADPCRPFDDYRSGRQCAKHSHPLLRIKRWEYATTSRSYATDEWSSRRTLTLSAPEATSLSRLETFVRLDCPPETCKEWLQCMARHQPSTTRGWMTLYSWTIPSSRSTTTIGACVDSQVQPAVFANDWYFANGPADHRCPAHAPLCLCTARNRASDIRSTACLQLQERADPIHYWASCKQPQFCKG